MNLSELIIIYSSWNYELVILQICLISEAKLGEESKDVTRETVASNHVSGHL